LSILDEKIGTNCRTAGFEGVPNPFDGLNIKAADLF
jgi:hypothetical protein